MVFTKSWGSFSWPATFELLCLDTGFSPWISSTAHVWGALGRSRPQACQGRRSPPLRSGSLTAEFCSVLPGGLQCAVSPGISFQLVRWALFSGPVHSPILQCRTWSSPNARPQLSPRYFQPCSACTQNAGREAEQKHLKSRQNTKAAVSVRGEGGEVAAQGPSGTEPRHADGSFGLLETPRPPALRRPKSNSGGE